MDKEVRVENKPWNPVHGFVKSLHIADEPDLVQKKADELKKFNSIRTSRPPCTIFEPFY